MKKNYLIAIVALCFSFCSTFAQTWEAQKARIMTPWADQLDPKEPLPEYPRPQMVRDNWMNLNGLWDFELVKDMAYTANQKFGKKILVPFPMESALSGIMDTRHDDNKGRIFLYHRSFSLPASMKNKTVLLHFGAVDWKCKVYLNGREVGGHLGGFDPFVLDISSALDTGKDEQELEVFVQDYQEFGGYPHGKQKIGEKIIWYTPVTGIWQTVWIEAVSPVYIDKLVVTPSIDLQKVSIRVVSETAETRSKAKIEVFDGDKRIAFRTDVRPNEVVDIQISDQKLWSPDSPFLYDLKVELTDGEKLVDVVGSYFGMRKIAVDLTGGQPRIRLNNQAIFQYGFLDQGYWPDGIYTAPTDEALKSDILRSKEFGMNMVRKHIKVEPARWYTYCDRLGILVWQDIPNPGFGKDGKILGEQTDLRDNFHKEMVRIMETLHNHPSIVLWTVYNESWGQPDEKTSQRTVDIAREQDTSRLISIASGWNDSEYGDIKDTHWYPEPNMLPNKFGKRASVCGEYGGITLLVDGHRWIGGSNMKYTQVYSPEELKERFIQYTNKVDELQAMGLCAAVYTQLTDVEDEENGMISYDRKVVKVNDEQLSEIRKAIEHTRSTSFSLTPVMPISQSQAVNNEWRYLMTDKPLDSDSWTKADFSDKAWKEAKAGFGQGIHQDYVINTNWNSPFIYLRKELNFANLAANESDQLKLLIFHDEDCEVYINGILAAALTGYTNRYIFVDLRKEAVQSIRPGQPNLVAVRCKQTVGGQFIDLGFSTRK
ncbi:MAG: glycoside hydrolase family 2 protein [Mangrovibacterium sp.]